MEVIRFSSPRLHWLMWDPSGGPVFTSGELPSSTFFVGLVLWLGFQCLGKLPSHAGFTDDLCPFATLAPGGWPWELLQTDNWFQPLSKH